MEITNWKPHYKFVIDCMFKEADDKRFGKGQSYLMYITGPSYCKECGERYDPNQCSGCDSCFRLKFMESLTDDKIKEYIEQNKMRLTQTINNDMNNKNKSNNIKNYISNKLDMLCK